MIKKYKKNKYNSGATLIELLVVIVIFMILTTITIFNYGKFNSSLSIQNLADDIALTVRRAQGFAIGVRGYGSSFSQGYGVHFTANPGVDIYAGSNKSFILFADIGTPSNMKYEYDGSNACGENRLPTAGNECIEALNIVSADVIKSISLNSETTPVPVDSTIDIMFRRPNPEPIFCYRENPDNLSCDTMTISQIKVNVSSLKNPEIIKTIIISNNGQINVAS